MLITGYYDGATDGFVQCNACGQTYGFRKLAWDEEQDVRIFALAALDQEFDAIRTRIYRIERDENPTTFLAPTPSAEQRRELERLLANRPDCVVAATDLQKGILAKKEWEDDASGDRDWFAWIGLSENLER